MPIDLSTHFNNFSDSTAMSLFGRVFAHPVSVSILIVIIVLLIANNMEGFKLFFYLFGLTLIAMIIHDTMNESQIKQKYQHKYTVGITNNQPSVISPPNDFEPINIETPISIDDLEKQFS